MTQLLVEAGGPLRDFGGCALDAAQFRLEVGSPPFEIAEGPSQRQRAGARPAPAGHQPVVVVLAGPRQEVALGVRGGQALGGGGVLDQVRAPQRLERQITVKAQARLEAHQVSQSSQHAFGIQDAVARARVVRARMAVVLRGHLGYKKRRTSRSLALQQRDPGPGFFMALDHNVVELGLKELFHNFFIAR